MGMRIVDAVLARLRDDQMTLGGDLMLRALAAYAEGDMATARDIAKQARSASVDAFAARYADALCYDSLEGRTLASAERSTKRYLIANGDIRAFSPLIETARELTGSN